MRKQRPSKPDRPATRDRAAVKVPVPGLHAKVLEAACRRGAPPQSISAHGYWRRPIRGRDRSWGSWPRRPTLSTRRDVAQAPMGSVRREPWRLRRVARVRGAFRPGWPVTDRIALDVPEDQAHCVAVATVANQGRGVPHPRPQSGAVDYLCLDGASGYTAGDTGRFAGDDSEQTRRFRRIFDAEGWPSGRWRWS